MISNLFLFLAIFKAFDCATPMHRCSFAKWGVKSIGEFAVLQNCVFVFDDDKVEKTLWMLSLIVLD